MKKTIQSFLVLSLVLLSLVSILLCVSFQVGVAEARFRHLGVGAVKPTPMIGRRMIGVGPPPLVRAGGHD
ncbi:hypothetical protein Bca4012_083129 [Brassica carinata]